MEYFDILYGIYQSGMIVIYDLHLWSVRDLQRCRTTDLTVFPSHARTPTFNVKDTTW